MLENWKRAFGLTAVIVLVMLFGLISPELLLTQPRPANVRDADNGDRQEIYNSVANADFAAGIPVASGTVGAPVPAGKRLIVEQISFKCYLPAGQLANLFASSTFIPATHVSDNTLGGTTSGTMQLVKIRFDAGTGFGLAMIRLPLDSKTSPQYPKPYLWDSIPSYTSHHNSKPAST